MTNNDKCKLYKNAFREVAIEERKKGFKIHLLMYVIFNMAFAGIYISTNPESNWLWGPLFGWGSGIAFHYIFSVALADKVLNKMEEEVETRVLKA